MDGAAVLSPLFGGKYTVDVIAGSMTLTTQISLTGGLVTGTAAAAGLDLAFVAQSEPDEPEAPTPVRLFFPWMIITPGAEE
jgi:hypothetical protein